MLLYKIVFGSTFGRGARHPFRSACLRVGVLEVIALALGWALATMLPPLPLLSGQVVAVFCASVFVTQLTVFIALVASYGTIRPGHKDILARLLLCWPVKPVTAWVVLLIPGLTIVTLSLSFIEPSLHKLVSQLGLNAWTTIISVALGSLSVMGFLYGTSRKRSHVWGLAGITILVLEYFLLRAIFQDMHALKGILGLLCLSGIAAFGLALLAKSRSSLVIETALPSQARQVSGRWLHAGFWFIKKILRGHPTRGGALVTLAMSVLLIILFHRLSFIDTALTGSIMSLLAAAFVSDMRSLTRKYKPYEIVGLRGTKYFMRKQLESALVIGLLATSPLLVGCLVFSPSLSLEELATNLGLPWVLGIAAGLFTSTLLSPGPRDITAQSGATLFAAGIFILPSLSIFSQLTDESLFTIKVALVTLLLLGAIGIECKRNYFIWRKIHVSH